MKKTFLLFCALCVTQITWADTPSGLDIVKQCDNKPPGDDQRSQLTVTIESPDGSKRTRVYQRYWKDAKGKNSVFDKMLLFTVFPADAEGTGFMRWAYTEKSGKKTDQWIYLPELNRIRRVSIRDLADSFLGTDLTYGDITFRAPNKDRHKLLGIDKDKRGNEYWVVESVPKHQYQYSKWRTWYLKTKNMSQCAKARVVNYDRKGGILKVQDISWQQIDGKWVWDKVYVSNAQTRQKSHFQMTKVRINEGINDRLFSKRSLRKGI